jgi:hypothetical protein
MDFFTINTMDSQNFITNNLPEPEHTVLLHDTILHFSVVETCAPHRKVEYPLMFLQLFKS